MKKNDLLYRDFWLKNNKWYGYRKCPRCNSNVLCYAQKDYLLLRNIRNKNKKGCLCKKCYSEVYSGENNPFFGKNHTQKTKTQISNNRVGKCTGDCSHMRHNGESKRKVLEGHKKFYMDKEKSLNARLKQSEIIKENIRLGKLKTQNKSKKEKEIKIFLEKMGYEIIPYFRVDTKICDFFLPKLNLIIEYNGDYWHCNPKKYKADFFNHKKGVTAKELWDNDSKRLQLIRNYGYNVEVIWEEETKYNNNIVLEIIKKYETTN